MIVYNLICPVVIIVLFFFLSFCLLKCAMADGAEVVGVAAGGAGEAEKGLEGIVVGGVRTST